MTNPWGDRDWTTYYDAVAGKPPRETLVRALDEWERDSTTRAASVGERWALDLGAGEGRDTRELLRRRFQVVCVDPHPDAARRIRESVRPNDVDRVEILKMGIEDVEGHGTGATRPGSRNTTRFDIVNASFSLPFVHPSLFGASWSWIRSSIAPGGYFAGQFFGPQDSWATIPGRSHFTREQVQEMLEGLSRVQFDESEKDGSDAERHPKHWHVFHIVAQRPPVPKDHR